MKKVCNILIIAAKLWDFLVFYVPNVLENCGGGNTCRHRLSKNSLKTSFPDLFGPKFLQLNLSKCPRISVWKSWSDSSNDREEIHEKLFWIRENSGNFALFFVYKNGSTWRKLCRYKSRNLYNNKHRLGE